MSGAVSNGRGVVQRLLPFAVGGLALLLAHGAQANEALARKKDCLGCHAVAVKLVGPAYQEVATRYAGQSDAVQVLSSSIRKGSVGKWGDVPMPEHPKLTDAELKKLATWVLGLK
jgi:cytochrome c